MTNITTPRIDEDRITEQLDRLEENLPSIPGKTLNLARATVRRGTAIVQPAANEVSERFCAVANTVSTAVKTVVGQGRSAAERSATTVQRGVAETTGQTRAQVSRVVDTIESETAELIDDAERAVDPQPLNPASLADLTKSELYERAQALDIEGRGSMSKPQLIKALRAH